MTTIAITPTLTPQDHAAKALRFQDPMLPEMDAYWKAQSYWNSLSSEERGDITRWFIEHKHPLADQPNDTARFCCYVVSCGATWGCADSPLVPATVHN